METAKELEMTTNSRLDVQDFLRSEVEFLNDLKFFIQEWGNNLLINDIVIMLEDRAEQLGG